VTAGHVTRRLLSLSDQGVADNLSRRTVHCARLTAVSRIQQEWVYRSSS